MEIGRSDAETLLVGYLKQALQKLEAGEAVDAETLCGDHPHLAAPLAEALGLSDELGRLQRVAASTDPLAGMVLSERYELEERLGAGAMGIVYRGVDRELGRPVAVKILDARVFANPVTEQRFARESELLATLRHEHVVAVHDRGRSEAGVHFIVMEHLVGASLAEVLVALDGAADPMAALRSVLPADPPDDSFLRIVLRWGADLASALVAAHGHGVFHRDVKPSNVFVCSDYRVVLLDFGIAVRDSDARLTASATTLGTPWYMAPEQAGGARAEPTLDVYGLTATLYHLLVGRPPYEGDPAQVLVRLAAEDPARPGQVKPELPRDVQAILEHGMEREPSHRYPTADRLEEDLRAFLAHRPVSVRPLSRRQRWLRSVRRSPARTVAVVSVFLALVAVGIAVPMWSSARSAARRAEVDRHLAQLPSLLAFEGDPEQRLLASLSEERNATLGVLDRILELDPAELPSRLWRASLRLDEGRVDAAAADLDVLRTQTGSRYIAEVAQCYQAAAQARGPEVGRGTKAVDLTGLPEPETDEECFVAGFHELRNRHVAGYADRADALLERASSYTPARDLRLISLLARGDLTTDREERRRCFALAHDESLVLEGIYGRPTARTLACRGVALIAMRRYEEAIAPLLASVELRPGRHGPLHNLGLAYRRSGEPEKAFEYLTKAFEVRPHFSNTLYTLAQLYRDYRDFDTAYEFAEKVAPGPPGHEWKREDLFAEIALHESYAALETDRAKSVEYARRSLESYDRAIELAPNQTVAGRLGVRRAVAEALGERNLTTAFVKYLEFGRGDALNPFVIANVAGLLPPEGVDDEAAWWLRLFLRTQAFNMAEGDQQFREQQQQAFQKLLEERK